MQLEVRTELVMFALANGVWVPKTRIHRVGVVVG
jgi:hypothetical protein